jgi:hypothetical protein
VIPPEDLGRPILKVATATEHSAPTAPIKPSIDGEESSYFEWMGAGIYRVDGRSGAMHGQRSLLSALHYGSDGHNLYVRLDFNEEAAGVRACLNFDGSVCNIELNAGSARVSASPFPIDTAFRKILEGKVAIASLGAHPGDVIRLQLSLWRESLPLDALPQEGWLRLSTAEPE